MSCEQKRTYLSSRDPARRLRWSVLAVCGPSSHRRVASATAARSPLPLLVPATSPAPLPPAALSPDAREIKSNQSQLTDKNNSTYHMNHEQKRTHLFSRAPARCQRRSILMATPRCVRRSTRCHGQQAEEGDGREDAGRGQLSGELLVGPLGSGRSQPRGRRSMEARKSSTARTMAAAAVWRRERCE